MTPKDTKNLVTTICAIISLVCGVLIATQGLSDYFPPWVLPLLMAVNAIAAGLSQIFIGRNADGSKKTAKQIQAQNEFKKQNPDFPSMEEQEKLARQND